MEGAAQDRAGWIEVVYIPPGATRLQFNENFLFHNHDPRNTDNLHLVGCQTSYGPKSIKYKGSTLWNQLPTEFKLITSINSFKSKLKLTLSTSHN